MAAKKKAAPTDKKADTETNSPAMDNKTLIILAHLLGIFLAFIGPLVILLIAKDEEVKTHAKNALNWQITFTIVCILFMPIFFILAILSIIPFIGLIFGLILFALMFVIMILVVVDLAFCVIAAIKANEGTVWKYPFSFPFLK
ncbi:MAG: DUF4870 domain-containing protein [archaeon]